MMTLILGLVLILAIGIIVYLTRRLQRMRRAARERKEAMHEELIRSLDAFEQDLTAELVNHTVPQRIMEHLRSSLASQSEQFAAFSDAFAYDPKDARFLGSPIDFVVFSGRSNGTVDEVVFVEVKQHAKVALTKPEASLKDAVESGSVRWERLDLADGSGISRERVRELGAEDLEADVSRAVREKARIARQSLVERLTKHL